MQEITTFTNKEEEAEAEAGASWPPDPALLGLIELAAP